MNIEKPYIKTEIYTSSEQIIVIQPGSINNAIEFYFKEKEGEEESGLLYIEKSELPTIIAKLQEMMNYTEK